MQSKQSRDLDYWSTVFVLFLFTAILLVAMLKDSGYLGG